MQLVARAAAIDDFGKAWLSSRLGITSPAETSKNVVAVAHTRWAKLTYIYISPSGFQPVLSVSNNQHNPCRQVREPLHRCMATPAGVLAQDLDHAARALWVKQPSGSMPFFETIMQACLGSLVSLSSQRIAQQIPGGIKAAAGELSRKLLLPDLMPANSSTISGVSSCCPIFSC